MPDETVITWDQMRLAARQNLKQWAEGRQMPLYRRRESVTADEVIAKLKAADIPDGYAASLVNAAIQMIEVTILEICGKNGIENEPDPRGGKTAPCVDGPLKGQHHRVDQLNDGDRVALTLPVRPIEPDEPIYHPFSPKALDRMAGQRVFYTYADGVLKYAPRR